MELQPYLLSPYMKRMMLKTAVSETGAVVQVSNTWPATKEDKMSSIALNSRNITMISRLLREARKTGDTQDLRTDAARYLTRRFQEGTRDEGRLEIALTQFIKKHRNSKSR